MGYFVGLDVSVKETSVCVVDDSSKVISEQKVLTEPDNDRSRLWSTKIGCACWRSPRAMTPFERRLSRLEAARNIRFQGRRVGVIFDADEADIDAGSLRYKRTREVDESPDDFKAASWSRPARMARRSSP